MRRAHSVRLGPHEAQAVTDDLPQEARYGMANMIAYLRDVFTVTPRDNFTRDEILVLLKITADDSEIFPNGEGAEIWGTEVDAG